MTESDPAAVDCGMLPPPPPPPIPLAALAAGAYAAGCVLGFTQFALSLAVVVGTCAIVLGAVRRWALTGVGILAVAGLLAAHGTAVRDARCLHRLRDAPALGGTAWRAVLEAPAAPGAYAPAELRLGRCRLRGGIAVRAGVAPGGASVQLEGTATVRNGRVLVTRAVVRTRQEPGVRARWRARAARSVDRVFARDRALAHALLLADMRSIAPDVKDRFVASGLVHALSVSGMHVGIIAMAAELVFGVLVGARAARLATMLLVTVYVAMIGAPAPAVRSAVMLGAVAASRTFERPTTPWAVVAMGAVGPLSDPRTVLDLGYQLSVLGVASLVVAARVNGAVFTGEKRWWTPLAAAVSTGVIATLASTPLVAYGIGRVSLIGPLSNVLAGPLLAVAQPALFLGLVLAPIDPLARVVGDAVHVPLALLDVVARTCAALPFAAVTVSPTFLDAVLAGAATFALLAAGAVRTPRRALWVAAVAGTALAVPVRRLPTRFTEVHVIDVGQGDAIAIRTTRNRWVLVDAGRSWNGGDAARATILPYLRRRGSREVVALVLTHPHTDHIGGARTVVEALRPHALYDGGFVAPAGAYRDLLRSVGERRIPWRRPNPGDSLVVDEVVVRFLAPDRAWVRTLHDANDASVVTMVQVGARRVLLTGDAERAEEEWLVAQLGDRLRADVLKAGHHGSRTSSTPAFLAAVRPEAVVISVGAGNDYGHPSPSTLDVFEAAGAQIARTDRSGHLVIRTDGRRLSIHAHGETWHSTPSPR